MPKVIGPLWEPKSQYWLKIEVGDDGILTRYKAIPKEAPDQDENQVGVWEPLNASRLPRKPDWLVWDSSETKIIHYRLKDKKMMRKIASKMGVRSKHYQLKDKIFMRRFATKIGMRFEQYIDGEWQPSNAKDFGLNTDPLPTEKEVHVPAHPKFAEALTWEEEREKDFFDVGLNINTKLHGTQQKSIIGAIDIPLELLKQITLSKDEYIRALRLIVNQKDKLPSSLRDVIVEHIKEFRVCYLSAIRIDSCKVNASNQVGQKMKLGDVLDFILNRIILELEFYKSHVVYALPTINRNGVWDKYVGEAFKENSGFSVNGNMQPYIQERYELMKEALKNGIEDNSLEELKKLNGFIKDFRFDEPGFGGFSAETSSVYKLLEIACGSADNFWNSYDILKENVVKRIEELDKQQTALAAEQKVQEWIKSGILKDKVQDFFDQTDADWKRKLTAEPLCTLISNGSVGITEALLTPLESLIRVNSRTAMGYVDYLLNKRFVSEEQFSLIVNAALNFEEVMHKVLNGRLFKWLKMTPKVMLAEKYWEAADRLLDDEGLSPEERYSIIGHYVTSTTPELSHKLITKICNNSSLLSRLTPIEKIPVYTAIERFVNDGHKEFRATLEEIRSGSEAELICPLGVDLDILIKLQIFSQESTTDARVINFIFHESLLSQFIVNAFIHHESLIKNIRPATKIIIYDRIYQMAHAGHTHAKRAFDKIKDDWLIKLCPLDSKTGEHLRALGARVDDRNFWNYVAASHNDGTTFYLPKVDLKSPAVAVAFYLDKELHYNGDTTFYNVVTGHETIALHYLSNLKADDLFKGRNAKLVNAIAQKYLSVAKKTICFNAVQYRSTKRWSGSCHQAPMDYGADARIRER